MSVKLEPHNVTGYGAVTEEFKTKNRTALIRPTGTGKSFVVLKLIEDNEGKKVIYLAPSRPILQQLRNNMKQNGIKYKDANNKKLVEEYTYQKLLSMLKNDELQLEADYIILDEFHHCGAPEWGLAVEELLRQNPNAKVLGLSATPIRYFDETIRDMAEELFGNNIADEMNIAEAIEQGILKEPVYTTGIYDATEIMREYEEKVDKCRDEEKKKVAKEYLKDLRSALDTTVQGLPELLANSMTNSEGKYVVFCKNIEDMQKKMAEAQKMFGKVNSQMEIYSVSSKKYDDEGNEIEISETENTRQLKKFEKSPENGKLKLLFSVDMLSEGWHYLGLDGVVMMRPTSSPTLFAQQLGRGLSIGGDKQPIIIDLVNNADSIRVIENFYREFGNGDKKSHSVLSGIKISREMRDATEIIKKVDSLIQRKEYLTYEEKLELMLDYIKSIEGTDEKFTTDSQYKGYNLGHMRANLRANYWNGALKIDDELLQKFIEAGIIIEKPERIRTTLQEKYDFLISMIGKSEEELKDAKMESGLSYMDARSWIQHQYNSGKLELEPEQIKVLKDNGILNLSTNEIKGLESKYGISSRDVKKISNEYGDIDEFMEKFKRGEVDYEFLSGTYVGARDIIVSEKDLTVGQKKAYVDLAYRIFGLGNEDKNIKRIIDIDQLDKRIQNLRDRDKEIIIKRFGLDGKMYSCDEIGNLFGITGGAVSNYTPKILRQIGYSHRNRHNKVLIWDNDMQKINDRVDKLKEEEKMVDSFEKLLIYLNEQEEYSNINAEEIAKLDLDLSDEQIKILQLYYENTSCDKENVELYLENFYRDNLEKHLNEKYNLAVSKRYHEKFMEIYSELEEDYMENEDIFNPDSIITGKIIKDISIEDIEKEIERHDVDVNAFSISTLGKAAIRQADAEYIYKIFQMTDVNRKEFKEALKNIKGLPEEDIENIVYEKYINDKTEDEEIIFKDEDSIDELGLDIHEYNALRRQGIDTIGQLLSLYDIERAWTDLRNIKNIGSKGYDKVLKLLEKSNLVHKGKPTSEAERVVLSEYIDIPVEEIGEEMSVRAYNYLKREGLNNIGDILTLYDEEKGQIVFPKRINVGNKTFQEILALLEEKSFLYDGKPVKKGKEDAVSSVDRELQRIFDLDEVDIDTNEQKDSYDNNLDIDTEVDEYKQEGQKEDEQEETKGEMRKEESEQEQQQNNDVQEEIKEETQEQQESNLNNEYQELVLQIMECDTEYDEIQKNFEVINLKRDTIKTKIEELINQIDETANNNVTQTAAVTLMEAFELLQEQRALLKEIEVKLNEMNEVEKANREKRNELTKRLTEIIRGGE